MGSNPVGSVDGIPVGCSVVGCVSVGTVRWSLPDSPDLAVARINEFVAVGRGGGVSVGSLLPPVLQANVTIKRPQTTRITISISILRLINTSNIIKNRSPMGQIIRIYWICEMV